MSTASSHAADNIVMVLSARYFTIFLRVYTGRMRYTTNTDNRPLAMTLHGLSDMPQCSFTAQYLMSQFSEQGTYTVLLCSVRM